MTLDSHVVPMYHLFAQIVMGGKWESLLRVLPYHQGGFFGTNGCTDVVWLFYRVGQAAQDVLVPMHNFVQLGIRAE